MFPLIPNPLPSGQGGLQCRDNDLGPPGQTISGLRMKTLLHKTHPSGATEASYGKKQKESESKPEAEKTDPEGKDKVSSLQMRVLQSGLSV